LVNGNFSNGVTISGGTITVPAGVTSFTVTVPTTNDVLDEANETYNISVGGVSAVGTITDNDPTPSLAITGPVTINENAGTATYTVTLSAASGQTVTVNYSTTAGTATAGSDYTTTTGTLTFTPGTTSLTFTVPILEDALDEAGETYTATISAPSNATIGTASVTTSITDNDPTPSLAVGDVTVNESAGTMTFTVTLSAASGQTVTVNYATADGTAVAGSDYTAQSGTLTFAPGVTTQTITVPIINDTIDELAELFFVNLASPTNATISDAQAISTIVDNDNAPTISTVSAATQTEGTALVHTVTLSNASSVATTFAYSLGGGTATSGVDYDAGATFSNGVTLSGGVLIVPAGVTSFTVTVPSIQDTIDEVGAAETYNLTVGGVTGVGTITDDDAAPTLSVSDISVFEVDNLNAVFAVNLSNPSSNAVTVNLSFANGTATGGTGTLGTSTTDYGNNTRMQVSTDGGASWSALGTNTATFAAGQTTVLVRTYINANTGGTELASETFTLTATTTAGTTANPNATGTATIIDDTITVSNDTENEGTNLVFTVNVSAHAAAIVTTLDISGTASAADYGALTFSNGVTYNAGTGALTIPGGVTNFTVTIPTVNDTLDETNETIILNIGGAIGTGTITDNDATPTLSINDVTVNEAAGTATFTVTLSAASGLPISVDYTTANQTALSGSDFLSTSGTLNFAAGVTTQTVTVSIVNDTAFPVFEGAETFLVNLSAPVNATIADAQGVGTIQDNGTGAGGTDNDTPTFSIANVTVSDQSAGYANFVLSMSAASTTATQFSLALTNGTATGGGVDYGAAGATNLQVSTDNGATWVNATTAIIAANTTYVLVRTPILADVAFEVSETFTLTATRTFGTTTNTSAVGTATITDIDNSPNAVDDVPLSSLQEDNALGIVTLAGNAILGGSGNMADSDPTNDTLSITGAIAGTGAVAGTVTLGAPITVSGIYGDLLIQANGSYTYTLDNTRIQTQNIIGGVTVNDVFTYKITDGNGGFDTATISVAIIGTRDETAIVPQPVLITADGLSGEYYGYNDFENAGDAVRLHADDGMATALGSGDNLDSIEDITIIIDGRNAAMGGGNIVGGNQAGAINAADVKFSVRGLNYGDDVAGRPVNGDLGFNPSLAAGSSLPVYNYGAVTSGLSNFLFEDYVTAVVQTGAPIASDGNAATVESGLGRTGDAIIRMSGNVYLERGNYDFRVYADDGFRLRVGGQTLIEYDGNQAPTTRVFNNVEVSDLISGLTSIELLYWEQGGNANLQFEYKLSSSGTWTTFNLSEVAFFSEANTPVLTDTRIQDIVETSTDRQYELRTGSVLDGDGNINTLTGNAGRDYIQGFGGNDVLIGGGSADFLDGGDGNDSLDGGDGNDILIGGTGNDTMVGGLGDDIYRIDSALDVTTEAANEGTDTIEIEATYNPGTYVLGANFENVLAYGSMNVNITGNTSNNRLIGNDGNNVISAGAGNDRIIAGAGNDTLTGGTGTDVFEWNLADKGSRNATGSLSAQDVITDFDMAAYNNINATAPTGGDALDLRDLLSGEASSANNIGNLANYIDIVQSGANTVMRISYDGGFTGGTYNAAVQDQVITFNSINMFTTYSAGTNDATVILNLLNNGKLLVD
jgi:VCBS repeat-containing protein